MYCKLHVLQVACASSFMCCRLYVLQIACVVKGLKRCPFAPWSMCHIWKFRQLAIKIEKCLFVMFLGSQNYLPDEKMALKKPLLDGQNFALKITYRTWIWLSKLFNGWESGHQIFSPNNIYLTGKIYDYDCAWGGVESRIDYVICAHFLNHEPSARLSFSPLLPVQSMETETYQRLRHYNQARDKKRHLL